MKRVLLITNDVVGPTMAGPGIRAWELARVLGAHFPTTLAAPTPAPERGQGFAVASFPVGVGSIERLTALIADADIIITQVLPTVLLSPELLRDKYLVGDLYCPWLLENLEHFRAEPPTDADWLSHDLQNTGTLLVRGDYFICAGERQRAYWLGALAILGRLTEDVYAARADGRSLIDLVPFGMGQEPPPPAAHAIKGVVPGIGEGDFVALWGGGLWNWLDPLTLIRATALLRDRGYPIRTFFLGVHRPAASAAAEINPSMVTRTRALSAELGLTGSHVFFNDRWVPYADRAAYLQDADAGLSLHLDTLETQFAFRTRVLDYLWTGLVPVVHAGDTFGDLLQQRDAGLVVPMNDPEALAAALATLMDDPARRAQLRTNGRELAQGYGWEQVAAPLVAFCENPTRGARNDQTAAGQLYNDLVTLRYTLNETSDYAKKLEATLTTRDDHIARTRTYTDYLEHHPVRHLAAHTLRTARTISVRGALAKLRRR